MQTHGKARPLLDPEIVRGAFLASLAKLDPRLLMQALRPY